MYDNLLIETREVGNHRIKIYYDTDNECPVTNWDMGARYLFEYNDRYHSVLHDSCDWKDWFYENRGHSLVDALTRMAAEVVEQKATIDYYKSGKIQGIRLVYNRSTHLWELQQQCLWQHSDNYGKWFTEREFEPSDLKNSDCRDELVDCLDDKDDLIALISDCAKDFVIEAWSSTGYSQGDYLSGVAYMSKERFDKYVGFNPKDFKDWKEQARRIIELEVKEIGMWAWGDVKGFVLEKKVPFTKVYDDDEREDEEDVEWEEVDSCWGFYMETEDLIAEVISEHDLKKTA